MMQIVWCLGGLGNQMFQYAFYRALKLQGKPVYLDIAEFGDYNLHQGFELTRVFGVQPKIAPLHLGARIKGSFWLKLLRKLKLYEAIIQQTNFAYAAHYTNYKGLRYFSGYWQSELYFATVTQQIRNDFTFPALDADNQLVANQILKTTAVALHVRRGDYVNHPLHGGICTKEFYQQAITLIQARVKRPQFFIFSDDISWCQANLPVTNAVYVTGNAGINSYKDMHLMSLCRHNIIANSSFSWWGAWLNANPHKLVIAPAKWFNDRAIDTHDLIPKTWIKL